MRTSIRENIFSQTFPHFLHSSENFSYDTECNNVDFLFKKTFLKLIEDNFSSKAILTYKIGEKFYVLISCDRDTSFTNKLISFNGESITYDEIGNPITYRGATLSWDRGTLLSSYTDTQKSIFYSYDGQGRRISKTVNGILTNYFYINGTLIKENTNGYEIIYIYDNDQVIGFSLNNVVYIYKKNILGDIIAIHNSSGDLIARYSYDAWGNHEVYDSTGQLDTNPDSVGNINKIRYRSYYYDVETGLFMMGHRFYDPEIGRFISPDDVEYLDPTKINGLNLYAYCNNDPINYADPDGHAPQWLQIAGWIGLGVGAALCIAAVGILAAGVSTATLIGAIAVGAAKGALIGAGIGVGVGAIAGGAGAMISGEEFGSSEFWSDVGFGAMTGFGAGAVIGAVSGGFAGANGWYNAKALEFTNYGSSEVYLGKDPSYFTIAQQNGGTSFHVSSEIWNSTANMKGVNMWRINKAFLKQQIALGNKFVFTSYNITGMYAREVAYVLSHGIWAFLW